MQLGDLFHALLVLLSCLWIVASQQTDDVGACLLRGQWDAQRDCSGLLYRPSCLATDISPSLARKPALLECCFRCCYQYYLHLYNLQPSAPALSTARTSLHRAFPATYATLAASLGEGGPDTGPGPGLLLGATQAALALSAHVVTARGKAGKPPVQQLATLTVEAAEAWEASAEPLSSSPSPTAHVDVNAPLGAARIAALNALPWADLRASEALVVTPSLTQCAQLDLSRHPLTSSPTGLPIISRGMTQYDRRLAAWLSVQLPCPAEGSNDSVMNRSSTSRRDNNSSSSGRGRRTPPQLSHPPAFMLLPLGARDPAALRLALDRAPPAPSPSSSLSLDCRCALGAEGGRWPAETEGGGMPWLRGLLETLCSRHASGVTGSSADSGADGGSALPASPLGHLQRDNARARRAAERERDGFLRYYSALTAGNVLVLSLSRPNQLTACEWEAVQAGATPVMPQPLLSALRAHPSTAALYAPLPLLPLLPNSTLPSLLLAMQTLSTPSPHANTSSIAAAYLPRLLHALLPLLLTGKAAPSLAAFSRSVAVFGSQDRGCGSNSSSSNRSSDSSGSSGGRGLHVVVPLCCEGGQETAWLADMATWPGLRVHAYYKCPHCLPPALAALAPRAVAAARRLRDGAGIAARGVGLSEGGLAGLGSVTAHALFDLWANTKEVTAFLTYIVDNYSVLPPHVLFLHASPHAHLHFALFFAAMTHALCPAAAAAADGVDASRLFVPLNYLYRSGEWGRCCGHGGGCKAALWEMLFGGGNGTGEGVWPEGRRVLPGVRERGAVGAADKVGEDAAEGRKGRRRVKAPPRGRRRLSMLFAVNPHDVLADRGGRVGSSRGSQEGWGSEGHAPFAAYSSAQFLLSRGTLLSVPRAVYLAMLSAVNGSAPLAPCALSTNPAVGPWGGHQLTGQYERAWHVLWGEPRRQLVRSTNPALPPALRLDCLPLARGRCQEELSPASLLREVGGADAWEYQGRVAARAKLNEWRLKRKRGRQSRGKD